MHYLPSSLLVWCLLLKIFTPIPSGEQNWNKLHVTCLTPNPIISMNQIICACIIQIGIIETLCFNRRSSPPLAFSSLPSHFPSSYSVSVSLCSSFLPPFPFSFLSFVSCDKVILWNPDWLQILYFRLAWNSLSSCFNFPWVIYSFSAIQL